MTPIQANGVPRASNGYKLVVKPFADISIVKSEGEGLHTDSDKAKVAYPTSQLATVPTKPPSVILSQFRPGKIDLFQVSARDLVLSNDQALISSVLDRRRS